VLEKRPGGKTTIGWSEYIEFPDWDIHALKAKVDTGARTSALHVEDLKLCEPGWVEFYVVLTTKGPRHRRRVRAQVVKWAKVRSSTGDYRRRCFVKTHVKIGTTVKEIEISLVSRERMLFRMLLGRKALEKDFVVDVSKRGVLGKPKPRRRLEHAGGEGQHPRESDYPHPEE
jgi:hypothetical protein